MEKTYQGIGVSPGIAIASALVFDLSPCDVPEYSINNPQKEMKRLEQAIARSRDDLNTLYNATRKELGEEHANIFQAHLMILEDVTLLEEIQTQLEADRKNVEYVLVQLCQRYKRIFGNLEDPTFRERTVDLVDVVDRINRHLLHCDHPDLRNLAGSCIIVTHDLSPSDTAIIDLNHVQGIVLDSGSITSHTSILARALEVPAVMGLGDFSSHIATGGELIIDGTTGKVIADPTPETKTRYKSARQTLAVERANLMEEVRHGGPWKTLDGARIITQANVELPLEIQHCKDMMAEGIGLYRTEYLFLNRNTLPTETEQYNAYTKAVQAFAPQTVILRSMDIGGDKFVSHLQLSKEDNPQLGLRAVRFCLAQPDIFKAQLRAMYRAAVHGSMEIMIPMISSVDELRQVKKIIAEVTTALAEEGLSHNPDIPIGCMIEVPSAVEIAPELAAECDFFSIGTNDLIQYTLAVDRANNQIAHLYAPAHPAVLRMIYRTVQAAHNAGIPCHICGEMASDPRYTELLIGLGIRHLSMSSIALPRIRAEIVHTDLKEAEALAQEVLGMATIAEANEILKSRQEAKGIIKYYQQEAAAQALSGANGKESLVSHESQ